MKSKSLAEIQTALQEAVRSKAQPIELLAEILEKPPMSVAKRLGIYQDAYFIRLFDSLRDDFARTEALLGEDRFAELAEAFIKAHPSKVRDLAEYSKDFPEFALKTNPEAYEPAVRDWLQILTETSAEPGRTLTPAEIQSGRPFRVRKHPAVHLHEIGIASRPGADEVRFLEIEKRDFVLLRFFEKPRSLPELSSFAEQIGLSELELSKKVTNWIQSSLLYCEEVAP